MWGKFRLIQEHFCVEELDVRYAMMIQDLDHTSVGRQLKGDFSPKTHFSIVVARKRQSK